MKQFLLTIGLILTVCAGKAFAQDLVADVAVGTATVTNVLVGTATVRLDLTQVPDRVKFEVCTTTTTTLFCGYSTAIATATAKGIVGRPITNACWEKPLSNKIFLFCALGLPDDLSVGKANVILTQEGNGRN